MTLTQPTVCGLALGCIFSLVPIGLTPAIAGEHASPFPNQTDLAPQGTSQDSVSAQTEHQQPAQTEDLQVGILFPQSPGFDGLLAPSMAPDPIDPATAPSRYNLSAVVSYNYGVSFYNEEKVFQAREEWKTALRLQPTLPEAHYALSFLSHLQGNDGDATVHAIKARLHKSDWPAAAYHMGVLSYEGGHFGEASRQFLETLQLQPDDPVAMNGLGLSKLREGHLPDAAQALTMATEWNPNLPYVHFNLGLIFFTHQQWEQAGRQFSETLRLDPTLNRTHYWLGMTYAAMGQWTQAISSWQRAVAFTPHHPQIHRVYFNLGTAYWMTGNPIEARQAYQTALRDRPAWPQAYYQLGVIDMALSQWEKASEHFLTAGQLAVNWDQPYFNLGLVRYNQGLIDGARDAFQQAVILQPDFSDARYYLGLTLRIMHHDQEAFTAFEPAAQAGHIAAQEMLAGMYANGRGTTRNLTQAMQWWHRASRGHQGEQPADHARAQLSRLRQLYFLHRDNQTYAREILDGFQTIQRDMREEMGYMNRDGVDSYQDGSIGMTLASAGRLLEAIPVLVSEAYTQNLEAQRYLELLIQDGMLNGTPTRHAEVMTYFAQTASEGSLDSCRFLASLGIPSGKQKPHLQIAYMEPGSCGSSRP